MGALCTSPGQTENATVVTAAKPAPELANDAPIATPAPVSLGPPQPVKTAITSHDKLLRAKACILLHAVGDALGYRNGDWEFNTSGEAIHEEAKALGGPMVIEVKPPEFIVSDDTVMHIATANAIAKQPTYPFDFNQLMTDTTSEYIDCMHRMENRAPGNTCIAACEELNAGKINWQTVPYNPKGGGCGGSMRSACIGIVGHGQSREQFLIQYGVEAGRLTHAHPVGFLGSLVAATFTAFAWDNVPPLQWGYKFFHDIFPKMQEYVKTIQDNEHMTEGMLAFKKKFEDFLDLRQINCPDPKGIVFPVPYGINERDQYYSSLSFDGWGGASGDDSVIIAYEALLGANGSWKEYVDRGILHGGDSDSTGSIGAAWFGSLYGFEGVPQNHYEQLEFRNELEALAEKLADRAP
eukprot:TRINITY_DN327_c0_g1_i2.p1 TRINITY_DN327_c0_g1~~TRINITY_DN327_c0_g1_i2.p1  ORF type:complete len:409 (+),score=61.19 TRINITY_DN327_c0_g1_i2:38-1264(+)